ncbi:hypothetical protein ASF28_12815 [Methylobacterium sp. Leaf99]|uniref:hypothetical protein n=1 Tax=Methylobacterium sp. Leaf99 TaxID=1736251 RepID=UPI0006F9FC59|nr:hypothetical protein [Methylobacterium sp. Leaf99]KQP07969.1 hypothetical protein ASF28_12815 [Methylobacterium sp. Leaf99]
MRNGNKSSAFGPDRGGTRRGLDVRGPDPARPGLVTTDLALDRLWNRTVTLLVIAGALAAIIVAALAAMVRNRRAGAEAMG